MFLYSLGRCTAIFEFHGLFKDMYFVIALSNSMYQVLYNAAYECSRFLSIIITSTNYFQYLWFCWFEVTLGAWRRHLYRNLRIIVWWWRGVLKHSIEKKSGHNSSSFEEFAECDKQVSGLVKGTELYVPFAELRKVFCNHHCTSIAFNAYPE